MKKLFYRLIISMFLVFSCFEVTAQVTKDNLDQNADQSQGNYAATNLNYLGGIGSLGMMQSAWKDPLQHMGEGQTKPGYTKYYWTPDLVLPVRVREGMYTLINFPAWEVVENVYLGDGQSFNAQIQGPSSIMVYPDSSQFVGVDTNMVVFGRSGNKYVFYVQSETVNTDRITNAIIDIEVVNNKKGSNSPNGVNTGGNGYSSSNNSGGDASLYTSNLQKEDWIEKIPVDPTQFRFDIEVYVPNPDDIIIAPERVWRDNIFTYIDLGEKALTSVQRPIVTLIVERSETPVSFRAAGPNNRLIVVEAMGDMVLRSGKRMVCLKLRRADSDGLENTVYAKSNEWDIQNRYASQPDSSENNRDGSFSFGSSGPGDIEDVYGSIDAPVSSVRPNRNDEVKTIEDIDELFGNKTSIEDLPKVSPVIIPQKESSKSSQTLDNRKSVSISTEPQLTGEVEIQENGSDVVIPEYKNEKIVIKQSSGEKEKQDAATLGKSLNNSNPVLIASSSNGPKDELFKSPETEKLLQEFKSKRNFANSDDTRISIELGTDEDVNNLVKLWDNISKQYAATIGKYQQFYSVDTPADGQGKEVFHLRVGPVKTLEEGDDICSQLGRNGIFCSVVRIQ